MYPSPRPPQGRAKKGVVGFVPRKIRSRGNAARKERAERERDGEVERGKEAVNEDAKARSARAQK